MANNLVTIESSDGAKFEVSIPDNVVNKKGEILDNDAFESMATQALELRNNPPENSAPKGPEVTLPKPGFVDSLVNGLKTFKSPLSQPDNAANPDMAAIAADPLGHLKSQIPFADLISRMKQQDLPAAMGTGIGEILAGIAGSPPVVGGGVNSRGSISRTAPSNLMRASGFEAPSEMSYSSPSRLKPDVKQYAGNNLVKASAQHPNANNLGSPKSPIIGFSSSEGIGDFTANELAAFRHRSGISEAAEVSSKPRSVLSEAGRDQRFVRKETPIDRTSDPSNTIKIDNSTLFDEEVPAAPEEIINPEVVPESRLHQLANDNGITFDEAKTNYHPNDIIKNKREMQRMVFGRGRDKGLAPQVVKDIAQTTFNVDSLSKLDDAQLHSLWQDLDLHPDVAIELRPARTKKTGFTKEGKPVKNVKDAVDNIMNEGK